MLLIFAIGNAGIKSDIRLNEKLLKLMSFNTVCSLVLSVAFYGAQASDLKISSDTLLCHNSEISFNAGGSTDVSHNLQGKAAGVMIHDVSATFGSAPMIKMRGDASLTDNTQTLWIVDGVYMESFIKMTGKELSSGSISTLLGSVMAGINPEDIESVKILKEGAATSIYGQAGAGGVIVVTTRQGRSGRFSVNYTGEFSSRMTSSYA